MGKSFILRAAVVVLLTTASYQTPMARSSPVDLESRLRSGVVRVAVSLRQRSEPRPSDKDLRERARQLFEETSQVGIDYFFANAACEVHERRLFEQRELNAAEYFAADQKRAALEVQFAEGILAIAALPQGDAREFGELGLDLICVMYTSHQQAQRRLRQLLVDGQLPAEAVDEAQAILKEARLRIRERAAALDKATAAARERLVHWIEEADAD